VAVNSESKRRCFVFIHYSPLLKELAQGEDEFSFAVVAYRWGNGDDSEGRFGDDAEVDVLAEDGVGGGGTHLSYFIGGADVDAAVKGSRQGVDAAQIAGRDEEVVGAAELIDG